MKPDKGNYPVMPEIILNTVEHSMYLHFLSMYSFANEIGKGNVGKLNKIYRELMVQGICDMLNIHPEKRSKVGLSDKLRYMRDLGLVKMTDEEIDHFHLPTILSEQPDKRATIPGWKIYL